MARLTMKQRRELPKGDYAIPSKAPESGSYPINDKSHARAALSMVAAHGDSAEKQQVRKAVAEKYPSIEQGESALFRRRKPITFSEMMTAHSKTRT